MTDWLDLLRAAVPRFGSIQAVADQLDYSRTTLSLVLAGKYGKSTAMLERAVLARLDVVACPHLAAELPRLDCEQLHRRRMPQSDPVKLKHWTACQCCPVRTAVQAEQRSVP
jgi:hypothetical protein